MITYIEGDLFSSPAKVLVNTVNTKGVMGKGIALRFKKFTPKCLHNIGNIAKQEKLILETSIFIEPKTNGS